MIKLISNFIGVQSGKLSKKVSRADNTDFFKRELSDRVGLFLNLGAGRSSFQKFTKSKEIRCDIQKSTSVMVIADAHHLPFKKASFDTLMMEEVLEHCTNPVQVIKETSDALKPLTGKLILSTPFIFPIHDEPFDFFRFTKYGLKSLVEHDFENPMIKCRHKGLSVFPLLLVRLNKEKGLLKLLSPFFVLIGFLAYFLIMPITNKLLRSELMAGGYMLTAKKK